MSLIEEMEQGWLDHDKEFRVRLASVTDHIGPEFTAGLFAALEIVFILGGADMLRVLVHRNMLNDDILTGREAIKYTTDACDLVEMRAIEFGVDIHGKDSS